MISLWMNSCLSISSTPSNAFAWPMEILLSFTEACIVWWEALTILIICKLSTDFYNAILQALSVLQITALQHSLKTERNLKGIQIFRAGYFRLVPFPASAGLWLYERRTGISVNPCLVGSRRSSGNIGPEIKSLIWIAILRQQASSYTVK